MPRSFFDDRALVFDEGTFEEVPDVEADRAAFAIVGWALQPGDAVAFNMLTLHAAAGSATRRRAFSLRLLGDDVRYAPHGRAVTDHIGQLLMIHTTAQPAKFVGHLAVPRRAPDCQP